MLIGRHQLFQRSFVLALVFVLVSGSDALAQRRAHRGGGSRRSAPRTSARSGGHRTSPKRSMSRGGSRRSGRVGGRSSRPSRSPRIGSSRRPSPARRSGGKSLRPGSTNRSGVRGRTTPTRRSQIGSSRAGGTRRTSPGSRLSPKRSGGRGLSKPSRTIRPRIGGSSNRISPKSRPRAGDRPSATRRSPNIGQTPSQARRRPAVEPRSSAVRRNGVISTPQGNRRSSPKAPTRGALQPANSTARVSPKSLLGGSSGASSQGSLFSGQRLAPARKGLAPAGSEYKSRRQLGSARGGNKHLATPDRDHAHQSGVAVNIHVGGNNHHDQSHNFGGHHSSFLDHGYYPYALSHSHYSSYVPYYPLSYYYDVSPYYYGRSGFGVYGGGLSLGYSQYDHGYDIYPGYSSYGSGSGYFSSSYICDPYYSRPANYWTSYATPGYSSTYGPVYAEPAYVDDAEVLFDIDFYEPLYWDEPWYWGPDYSDSRSTSAWTGSYSADPFIHYSFANSFVCY